MFNNLFKAILSIVFISSFMLSANAQTTTPEKYSRVRIFATEKEMNVLNEKCLIYITGVNRNPDFVDAEVTQTNVEKIKKMGHQVEVIVEDMTVYHVAQANLEKAAKGKKVKKASNTAPVPVKK